MIGLGKLSKSSKKLDAIAVLTSGGDAPGMNAAIRAVVRTGTVHGVEVHGIERGYAGLLEGEIRPMDLSSVANIIQRGGTLLRTSRCKEFHSKRFREEAAHILRRKGINGLVVIGGDGSFAGAHLLENETGIPCIGVPATIDNDIAGTEETIGFDTAVNTAIDAIDRIRDTASSHERIFLVEVMGRNSGFLAIEVGIGGGAETIIIPEFKISIPRICTTIERGIKRGKRSSIIVVAEGKKAGLSNSIAVSLANKGYQPKVCILGHTQRGGTPSARDRLLGSVLGADAVHALLSGKSNAMIGVVANRVKRVPFNQPKAARKKISKELLDLAQNLAR